MANENIFLTIGLSELIDWGKGYDCEFYALADAVLRALHNLKCRSGDYPESIQKPLRELEAYAWAKEPEMAEKRYLNPSCTALYASYYRVEQKLIRQFEFHRLIPAFQNEKINEEIKKARSEWATKHPPKKGFWASFWG